MLSANNFDPIRFRTLWVVLQNALGNGWVQPPEAMIASDWRFVEREHRAAIVYPSAVFLYRLLEESHNLTEILDPAKDLDAVEETLADLLRNALHAPFHPQLIRHVRYTLRPDFYRVALASTPGWHVSDKTSYPPRRLAPHDRDLSALNFRTWPARRSGVAPGFPGFDAPGSPMYIVPETGRRFRHEFWYSVEGKLYEDLGIGHSSPSTWICRAGHVSTALLGTRNHSGRKGCGACAGRIAVPGVTDIATINPDAFEYWDHCANLADGLRYWEQTPGRSRAAHWKCPAGHCFELPINYFLADPHCKRCEVRNQRRIDLTRELTDFLRWWNADANPHLTLRNFSMWSDEVHWKCPAQAHPFTDTLGNLQRRGGFCPVCVHRRLVPGVNDLQTLHPEDAQEFSLAFNDGLTPDHVWPNSPTQYLWVCRAKGHLYHLSPRERTTLGIGCTKCSGRQIVQGETDLGSLRPDIAARWHSTANGDLRPTDVHPGSARNAYFTCLCDVPYKCVIRFMRTDRYCRRCTDQLRRWARIRGETLKELSTEDSSAVCANEGAAV